MTICESDGPNSIGRLILSYLVPCHLLTTHTLPSAKLLAPYPKLQKLFLPLGDAIKKADLRAFDVALQEGEDEFIRRRIYLTLERGRDIALRNLLRKVFVAGGFEEAKDGAAPTRRTRIPVAEFAAAMNLSSQEKIDTDEVECLLANMIYKVCPILVLRFVPKHLDFVMSDVIFPLANLLTDYSKNLMKGYIAHERGIVVLSKNGAFPGTGV